MPASIYSEAEDVNSVQLDIREGHAQTVEKTLALLSRYGDLKACTVCDAGCGTGSLAILLVLQGAVVYASDISSSMVSEADKRARAALQSNAELTLPKFSAQDLESLTGKYHTVACLDVLIHYPQDKASDMIRHLASLASFGTRRRSCTEVGWLGGPKPGTRFYFSRLLIT